MPTQTVHTCGPYEFLFWSDGGMQNGYLVKNTESDAESFLFCDSEGAEYIEHVMQLAHWDCISQCEAIMERFEPGGDLHALQNARGA